MKHKLILLLLIVPGFIFGQGKSNYKYVGVKKCAMCHKKAKSGAQYKLWSERKHSKSFEALKSDKGIKLAESKGLGKATEAAECLKCHSPGKLVDKKLMKKGFKPEDGVQCEVCHGAGDKYKSMKVMKDHSAAVKKGMREFKSEKDIKALCVTCHDGSEHTGKFDFDAAWKKVAHPTPNK